MAENVGSSTSTGASQGSSSVSGATQAKAMALADDATVGGFKSLEELRQKSPKLYKYMMISIAQTICSKMKRNQEHLAEIWRDMRNKSG